MSGELDLMNEMKKIVRGKGDLDNLTDSVDGVTGKQDIANKFKEVYECLYTSAESEEEMKEIDQRMKDLIRIQDSETEIEKLDSDTVKNAV